MSRESEDKAERILSIYTRLKQGKVIHKEKESMEYRVAPRTIQRDIADIQCFLHNQSVQMGEVQEVIYDKAVGGYILQTKRQSQLEGKEILAVVKILLESRSLVKGELFPIIYKLLRVCSDDSETKMFEDLLRNEMYHYVGLQHGKVLLDHLWILEQAVKNQQYMQIQYKKLKNPEVVTRKVKPVGIMFSEFYFYLVAYIEKAEKNTADNYPAFYRVDRLAGITILDEFFSVPYAERFEAGEFKKRVQFMYGGELRKVRLKCKSLSLEAVLDRFPTAEIISKNGEEYILQAEVFGDGIYMWLKGQGENIVEMPLHNTYKLEENRKINKHE